MEVMKLIIVLAEITFKENITNEIIDESKALIKASLAEEGCIDYKLFNPIDQDNSLLFLEKWKEKSYLELHLKQPHFINFHSDFGDLMEKREISVYSSEEVEL